MTGAIIVVICIIGSIIWGLRAGRKKDDSLSRLASDLGLELKRERSYRISETFPFLSTYREGTNRYASNIFSGTYRGCETALFDYHVESGSRGRDIEPVQDFSFFILRTSSGTDEGLSLQNRLRAVLDEAAETHTEPNLTALALPGRLNPDSVQEQLDRLIDLIEER